MVVEATLKGDHDLLIQAMSIDPTTSTMDFSGIPALCDDLLKANKQWLPRFSLIGFENCRFNSDAVGTVPQITQEKANPSLLL